MTRTLRVAMIGNGFMGAAHSQGWRVAPRFFDLPARPEMSVLVGRDQDKNARLAATWGWAETEPDYRAALERDDIDIVDIVTPGDTHAQIAIDALQAGKHVLCEKPMANSVDEAERMAAAAHEAATRGVHAMVGFTYRRVPAVAYARQLVASGALGEIRQVRAQYLQDWLADAEAPMTWRLDRSKAGSGALGDIGAHAVDLAQHVVGARIARVSGTVRTFVSQRPLMGASQGLSGTAGEGMGTVTVDDAAVFTAEFDEGLLGSFEATRMATGRKNALRLEVSGERGALAFDLEDMNALQVYDATAPTDRRGFTKVLVTEPEHPYLAAWWPPGHMLGYEHGFVHQAKDLIEAIAADRDPSPSFDDGLHVQRVLDAVERSSSAGAVWTDTTS